VQQTISTYLNATTWSFEKKEEPETILYALRAVTMSVVEFPHHSKELSLSEMKRPLDERAQINLSHSSATKPFKPNSSEFLHLSTKTPRIEKI